MVHANIDFRYWANGQQLPLPSWGKFYLQLGAAVAQENSPQVGLVTALAVPTRSHAAVLVAAGAVISKVKTTDTERQVSPAAHFDMLCSLPAGTAVVLHQGEKAYKGILVGCRDVKNDGTAMIGVQTQSEKGGSLTEWLPMESSLKVQLSSLTWTSLPANLEKAGVVNTSSSEFTAQVFQGPDLWTFVTNSTLDCVIIGSIGSLVQEATATKLSVGPQGLEASAGTGTLRDILRIRRLYNNNEAFRSDIFPVYTRDHSVLLEEITPHLVIFDGAVGFLKWRDNWSHCNWAVLLDRTEPRFSEAVQIVNEQYLSRISEKELTLSAALPPSVELVAFTVAR